MPTHRSASAFATGVHGGVRMVVAAVASEYLVERHNELAGAVAHQEPDRAVVAHHEVSGGLGRPPSGRVLGDPSEMHAARFQF